MYVPPPRRQKVTLAGAVMEHDFCESVPQQIREELAGRADGFDLSLQIWFELDLGRHYSWLEPERGSEPTGRLSG
ncbi:hypothetical protein TorRG33x02_185320 [Trema orientale]|uniref:Uncharacterized protein n=1 Tax=Trema orientale TaxID=63057 RepID=A0A2P5EJF8_TREOI|nr:hypothetical protein TorRG33x02_185320 [Trema orientale]